MPFLPPSLFSMFDLFRKRAATPDPAPVPTASAQTAAAEQLRQSRQGALVQAEEIMHDEALATEFILHCEYADARLKAAENIHSRQHVERVLQAVRNSDRRVAKLMLTRLEVCRQWEADEQHAAQCVTEARRLQGLPHLLPNQVVDLDKSWQQLRHIVPSLQQDFEQVRTHLRERLEAQANLQRMVIDALARLRTLPAVSETPPQLDALESEMARHAAAAEAASLPRNLLIEFSETAANLRRALLALERHRHALDARQEVLTRWEACEPAALKADALKREWQALPSLQDEALRAPLQERFEALLKRLAEVRQAQAGKAEQVQHDVQQQYIVELDAMEKALQEGSLQAAAEHDRALRALDAQALRASARQNERLHQARAELHHLQGWARWGGKVSREELLHAAESLPAQELAATELARKVGSLRERWKSLDVSAGVAGKDLWQRFDVACTAAYAPAAAHFKHLADERAQHAQQAQGLIEQARKFATEIAATDAAAVDWKAVAHFSERMEQGWHRLGAIARQQRKKLDADFEAIMRPLEASLAQQREAEVRRREALIAEALALKPQERGALDALRALQERWQRQAKALPLARKQEQALWQGFRQACDAVFVQRKEASQAADAGRRQHLAEKEALCARLETMQEAAASAAALREARAAWDAIGAVPHAAEQQIEKRYRQAVHGVQQRLDALQRQQARERGETLRRKLKLCLALERQAANADPSREEARAAWQALPALAPVLEKILQERFEAVLAASGSEREAYAKILEANRPALQRELLLLEIAAGVDSPPALARERLQLQVEVLQSSFKTGHKAAQDGVLNLIAGLCRLPALVEEDALVRIDCILDKLAPA